jgi:hypothetical protein
MSKNLIKFAARGKIQRKVAQQIREKIQQLNTEKVSKKNEEKLKNAVLTLSEKDQFSAQKFWKMMKTVKGSNQSCNSVLNQQGREVYGKEEIIEAYREEFDQRLSSVEIKPSLKNYEERTKELCQDIIKTVCSKKQPDFSMTELTNVLKHLKAGKSCGPDQRPAEIYIHGGESFHHLLLVVINRLKNSQMTPTQWEMMTITTLYKGKGSKKDLVNQRGIFLTQVICKIWERLIMARIGEPLSKINKLQAGSKKNRSPGDQTFILRGCIDRALYLNKPLYLNFYDFKQCFDKVWLEESIISLYKLGLDTEFLALIYKTNQVARIVVKTPHGVSKPFTKHSLVKQGSVTASSLCSASTGEFCDEHKKGGMPIGAVTINSLAYVDDLTLINNNITDSKASHEEACFFSDKKKQPLNEGKCFLLPVNCKNSDPLPIQEVNGTVIQIKSEATYVGDVFNSRGNNNDLIKERRRKGTSSTVNAMSTCSDSAMGRYTINGQLLLYKTVFLQTVLSGSKSWTRLTSHNISQLDSLQMKYLKWMLHTPRGTCNSFTLLELGLLPMQHEINIRKLGFLYHILNLHDEDPVKQVYREEQRLEFEPNWANEVKQVIGDLELPHDESEIQSMSKTQWKNLVNKAVTSKAYYKNSIMIVWVRAKLQMSHDMRHYQNNLTSTFYIHPKLEICSRFVDLFTTSKQTGPTRTRMKSAGCVVPKRKTRITFLMTVRKYRDLLHHGLPTFTMCLKKMHEKLYTDFTHFMNK